MRYVQLVAALGSLLAACVGGETAEPIAGAAECLGLNGKSLNGKSLNGSHLQGRDLNGRNLNGSHLQGRSLNGKSLNGSHLQGRSLNGKSLNGDQLQGRNLNGKSLNGSHLQGRELNGRGLNGQDLQGTASEEVWVQEDEERGTPWYLPAAAVLGFDFDEATAEDAAVTLELAGGRLRGRDASGALLEGRDLIGLGLVMRFGPVSAVSVTISDVEPDSADPQHERYVLTHRGEGVCGDGVAGTFLRGVWSAEGNRLDRLAVGDGLALEATFACPDGILAKCVRWGYEPWAEGADVHQTCTRLARADYCGDGHSYTRDGTLVDVYDVLGVMTPEDPSLPFEAGWGPEGAVCVSRPRYELYTSAGDAVLPSCWDSLPSCGDWEAAIGQGVLLGNSSRHVVGTICE